MVDVSGANQYKVEPAELISTCWPLMVWVVSVVPDELADEPAAGAWVAGVCDRGLSIGRGRSGSGRGARSGRIRRVRVTQV